MQDGLLFAYGTLKRGQSNHRVLRKARAEFAGAGRTVQSFPLVVSGLPFLLDVPGRGHRVRGELYRVGAPHWPALDRFEGHPDLYHRRLVEVETGDGQRVEAWAYFLTRTSEDLLGQTPVESFG